MGVDLPGWIIAAATCLCAAVGALFVALNKAMAERVADSQRASDQTLELATAGQATISTLSDAVRGMQASIDKLADEQRRAGEVIKGCERGGRQQ